MHLTSPWRQHFPCFELFDQQGVTYLDSAATAQKPHILLQVLQQHYASGVANVHRAQHALANRITAELEQARATVLQWLGATDNDQLIFTKGATDALNLVCHGLSHLFQPGDEIAVSLYEHHANLIPWQQLCQRLQLKLVVLPFNSSGALDPIAAKQLITPNTKLLALSPLSNVFGITQDLTPTLQHAKQCGALRVLDCTQYAVHQRIDQQLLQHCDFLALSSHKLFGPDGVGILWASQAQHSLLHPYQFGGEMVAHCSIEQSSFLPAPLGFEPGTPNIAGILAFAKVLQWLADLDQTAIQHYEQALHQQLIEGLEQRAVKFAGSPNCALASFSHPQVHSTDLATLLAEQGIAIRAGSHCAQPLLKALGAEQGLLRVSLGFYNDSQDLTRFFSAYDAALELLL
ncbi:aminotransferase class V-fold PLP-dependent enzyme [Thiopseudomonas alkaliphila]|uniref:aminotransferase class V-fold PLP-dependent enzyme n=1 Tax=Thiopseudomonas alkaliphila TaxID=1697053 RepID=UPI002578F9CD|nr:cysteine desulfurase [Thiopseudomonas alkaliphila]MDM1715509.1 cysteine desulfurase [Thiopseudomonas alkaliphila]